MTSTSTNGTVVQRNNVRVHGNPDGRPMLFAHGFGCSQEMWRAVAPAFTDEYRVVLFDAVGSGASDVSAYDPGKYDSLHGYAQDVLEIIEELDLHDVIYVGHSVSAMVGVLAANRDPSRFGALVLVGPSPRYVNEPGYVGGFEQPDIDGLLDALDSNYLGWSATMAPVIMGNADRPELGEELTESFCTVDPEIARHFARVTFLSDNRRDLAEVVTPTVILQTSNDVIAPEEVGRYVHEHIRGSEFVMLDASGHCPNISAPDEVVSAIRSFLR
ncbi:sigma-B regulation protein RsbQ [Diaminobutyricimonas aerilata]|uniref:Sigma-B regulation protein RsbQ n=1 Tax=Diaminobutyricimonas aerilata TaxID=1162967 RepID=A0A2M9CG37_9MICO|nr:alpha/beta hydrolase [Diaminobutyricimonas aerilata]PJJ70849.1 sigma-B regulation protein RsbQ [Diaminobutyricimonas aerilata]